MRLPHRTPRPAHFVFTSLNGEQIKAKLWPGETWNINDAKDGTPMLKITSKNGTWQIEQLTPFLTLNEEIIEWAAAKQTTP